MKTELEIIRAIADFWKEGDAMLSPGALLFDDETTIKDAVLASAAEGEAKWIGDVPEGHWKGGK